ncbi:hypothetical protein ANANG_G00296580 [Anguilla anguilla]|uniref:Uncharacterized protein n=1 Tax=Anguilla anguilla TaxID=7936 RepID=A0A9D3LNW9_ANGAN|nr:hypothetical protein ANANG_G00296580 [Anguilla anguilla]
MHQCTTWDWETEMLWSGLLCVGLSALAGAITCPDGVRARTGALAAGPVPVPVPDMAAVLALFPWSEPLLGMTGTTLSVPTARAALPNIPV